MRLLLISLFLVGCTSVPETEVEKLQREAAHKDYLACKAAINVEYPPTRRVVYPTEEMRCRR